MARSATPRPAPFTAWLGSLTDPQLHTLLEHRLDTAFPPPPTTSALAGRLSIRASILRALQPLHSDQLAVLETMANSFAEEESTTAAAIASSITQVLGHQALTPARIKTLLQDLSARGLVYPATATRWHLAPEVTQALSGSTGILPLSPDEIPATAVPAAAAGWSKAERTIVDTLLRSGGVGMTKDAAPGADPTRPIPRLIASGVLIPTSERSVELARSVREHLEDRLPLGCRLQPDETATEPLSSSDRSRLNAGAATAALETVRLTKELIKYLSTQPVPVLKNGALGQRPARVISEALAITPQHLARLTSYASAARLIAVGEPTPEPEGSAWVYLAPTAAAEEFGEQTPAQQWSTLAAGWLNATEQTWLVGGTVDGKKAHILDPSTQQPHLPARRRTLVHAWVSSGEGAPADEAALVAYLQYHQPLALASLHRATLGGLVEQAADMGVVATGRVTALAAAVLSRDHKERSEQARALIPAPVDTLIAQGDMTVLAPGPLAPAVEAILADMADCESPGLASVWRISESSLRRALNAGHSGDDLLAFLARHTGGGAGAVPEAIAFLIKDVARQHGVLRAGSCGCYLRCDDPALLAQAVSAVGPSGCGLRTVAPTVAVASCSLHELISSLRDEGFQPVAEDEHGTSIAVGPTRYRVEPEGESSVRFRHGTSAAGPQLSAAGKAADRAGDIARAVAALRRSEESQQAVAAGTKVDVQGSNSLGLIKQAARAHRPVTVGFVDSLGQVMHRTVVPLNISGGVVNAVDHASGDAYSFSLHRITEVVLS